MSVGLSGLTSDFDSNSLIEKLVELERRPLKRFEEEKEIFQLRIDVLEMINRDFKSLRESARSLYGLNSVFRRKTALGGDSSSFTVSPLDTALTGQYKMEVLRIAQAHSVASDSFPVETVFPAGSFTVRSGTNLRTVTFEGGSAEELAWTINSQAGEIVSAAAIRDTPATVIFQLVSRATGKNNTLSLTEDSGVFDGIPLVKPKESSAFRLDADNRFEEPRWKNYTGYRKEYHNLAGEAYFTDGEFRIVDKAVELDMPSWPVTTDTVLEISGRFETVEREDPSPQAASHENLFSRLFPVRVKEIEILGGIIPVNDRDEPEAPPPPSADLPENGVGIAFVSGTGRAAKRTEKLFPIDPAASSNGFSLVIPLDKGFDAVNRVILYAPAPERALVVSSLRIRSLSAGGLDFARTLQQPLDARFKMNDVGIERPSNDDLRDVIPNVALNLKAPSTKPATFTIDYALSDIRSDIVQFVSNYNICIDTLNQISKHSSATRPGEYDRTDAGLFSGDMAFINIRSKMRTTVSSAYPTSASNRLALASQLGLSTGEWGAAFEDVRSGRLRFDGKKFEETFRVFPAATVELFGSDTDGDKKLDNGLAFRMDAFLLDVVRPKSGLLDIKIEKTREDVRAKNKQITRHEEQVDNYEKKLKDKFGNMERNMSGLKAQQKWLDQRMNQGKKDD